MTPFDTVLMVDWSGGNDRGPTPVRDAIWACIAQDGVSQPPVYLRNRQLAETWIADVFERELAAGRRVLAGFDFPFGYPTGFCRAVSGQDDPLLLWDWMESRIQDAPDINNRFHFAGEVNRKFGGKGPFWGNALRKTDVVGLPRTKTDYANPFAEKRAVEVRAKGSFTCWQLAGAGAVGSQVLTGLPVLSRLRRRFAAKVSVWPFEPLHSPIAFIEIWPSLTVGPPPDGMIKDAWQVQELARNVSALDPATLAQILKVDASEEGWIFGVGHEDALSNKLAPPPLRNDCFALPAGIHWTPVADAHALLRDRLTAITGPQTVSVADSSGRVLVADAYALRSNPPLPNTAVDGYGFAGGRSNGIHRLPLVPGRSAAGDAPAQVPEGHAIRVLTGAALPSGVDTVVLQEDVTTDTSEVVFRGPVKPGSNTRRAGEDVVAGELILPAGRVLTAADVALLSATGLAEIAVRLPLRVGVLSTGDELVDPGEQARRGQIFDANRPMLLSMITGFGHTPVDLGRVADDRDLLRQRLDDASQNTDVIITSGGASAGDEDHVSALLTQEGAMSLWRIAVKPGRPLALGMWSGTPVFGLPGNPVAAMVCTLIFARPAMALLAGAGWVEPQGFDVPAGFHKAKKPGRREYLRARIREGRVQVFASEGSGRISGLSWAEGLVELAEGAQVIAPGDPVRYIPFASFGL
ncbi:MAG: gephyrin-like molybdotransferase Glp [Sulfitobacter sp.]